ncbi:hypothetical protein [Mycolicibacterium goodii]|uniref:hypothetical protein n=1 Tax=Mycolicibacterium goodii TaxID=134601 RepID=UPI00296FDBB7
MVIPPAPTPIPPRTRGRHRRRPERRWAPFGVGLAVTAVIGSLLTAFVVFTTLATKLSKHDSAYAVGVRMLPNDPGGGETPPHAGVPMINPYAFDQAGFVDSGARCGDTQTARAIGRTAGSLVVICLDRSGHFEYHGVRLTDNAALAMQAEKIQERKFLARNHGVDYAVSPTELLVTSGAAVVKREPMVEYREILASSPVLVAPR